MTRSPGALIGAVVAGAALCLSASPAQALPTSSFTCAYVLHDPTEGSLFSITCEGGPLGVTTGTVTNSSTGTTYRCAIVSASQISSFFALVNGVDCVPS